MSRLGVAIAAITLAAAPASAQSFGDLFVFGDSLVDAGNARIARLAGGGQDPAPPSLGYFQGRFSNGPNFADFLSQDLFGVNTTASLAGGTNFSVGGAQFSEVAGDASPSFLEQIDVFKASGLSFSPDSLVLITFGGNDVRREVANLARTPGYVPNLTSTLQAFNGGLDELFSLGARNVLITGLPDVGQIPAITSLGIPALSAAGTQLSFGLNQALGVQTAALANQTGYDLRFFDLFGYQQQLYSDPGAFGLPPLDTVRACLTVAGAAPGCNGFVYFDPIHPTSQIHRAIADGLTDLAAVPEPSVWASLILGFGLAGTALRRAQRPLARAA
jgi:outer membrane lipase/esterase